MQQIRIYCDQGHRRWNIATMQKVVNPDVVKELSSSNSASDRGLLQWHQERVLSNDDERENEIQKKQYERKYESGSDSDFHINDWLTPGEPKPLDFKTIVNGKEAGVYGHAYPERGHKSYTFKCEQCVKRKRHGTLPARQENLGPMLDKIAAAGLTEVPLEVLSRQYNAYVRAL